MTAYEFQCLLLQWSNTEAEEYLNEDEDGDDFDVSQLVRVMTDGQVVVDH